MGILICVDKFFGDGGKGAVGNLVSLYATAVIRAYGGPNSGQVEIVDGRRNTCHNRPIGMHNPNVKYGIIGDGCLVDPSILSSEIKKDNGEWDQNLLDKLYISERAQVILPQHIYQDIRRETTGKGVGSTRRGMSPASQDRTFKIGLRFIDLKSEKWATHFIARQIEERNLGNRYDPKEVYKKVLEATGPLIEHVCNTSKLLTDLIDKGENIYIGGNQGALLDPIHGTYPFSTSMPTTAAGMLEGAGLGLRPAGVIGIIKANATRVGGGPQPAELVDYERIKKDCLDTICEKAGITRVELEEMDSNKPIDAGQIRKKHAKEFSLTDNELFIIENSHMANAYTADFRIKKMFPDMSSDELNRKMNRIENLLGKEPRKELDHIIGKYLMINGGEFGASTGRPRRQGAMDIVALKHSMRVNNPTSLALTKLDVLRGVTPLPICTKYDIDLQDSRGEFYATDIFPADLEALHAAKPIFEYLDGFTEDITGITEYQDLPKGAIQVVEYLEEKLRCPIAIIGTGPANEQKIMRVPIESLYL